MVLYDRLYSVQQRRLSPKQLTFHIRSFMLAFVFPIYILRRTSCHRRQLVSSASLGCHSDTIILYYLRIYVMCIRWIRVVCTIANQMECEGSTGKTAANPAIHFWMKTDEKHFPGKSLWKYFSPPMIDCGAELEGSIAGKHTFIMDS